MEFSDGMRMCLPSHAGQAQSSCRAELCCEPGASAMTSSVQVPSSLVRRLGVDLSLLRLPLAVMAEVATSQLSSCIFSRAGYCSSKAEPSPLFSFTLCKPWLSSWSACKLRKTWCQLLSHCRSESWPVQSLQWVLLPGL